MSTTEQDLAAIRDSAARFLSDAATPEHLKDLLERPGSFDRATWEGVVEQGWTALPVREELGGLALGWSGLCVLAEEAGRRTVSVPLIANAVAIEALRTGLDASARNGLMAALISGQRIACLAFAEPGESGIAERPAMRWTDETVHGQLAIAAFGAVADVALVRAWDGQEPLLALVDLAQSGVTRDVRPTFDQARAPAALRFDGARAIRLSRSGEGLERATELLSKAALATAFEQVGGADACVLMARDYALERKVFGQPIGRFQAIKHKLAEMYYRTEVARGCALDALAALENGDPDWHGLAAGARLAATDAYDFAAQENAQTHGALGLTWEGMPHHHSRRARALALELGARGWWRNQMLRQLVDERAAGDSHG